MSRSEDDASLFDRLLEAGVYAPVGLLVAKSKTVPDLAAAGRKQIAFARSLGQAALNGFLRSVKGDEPVSGYKAPSRADTTGSVDLAPTVDAGTRLADEAAAPAKQLSETTPLDAAVEAGVAATGDMATDVAATGDMATDVVEADAVEADGTATGVADASEGDDASKGHDSEVPGYDDLTARQIIELMKTRDRSQAQWIHDRESSRKQRVTVLRAAARVLR